MSYVPADHRCAWCGNDFSNPRNTQAKKQVIWVRMLIRLSGELIRVRGAVCGKCRKDLAELQISILKAAKEAAVH